MPSATKLVKKEAVSGGGARGALVASMLRACRRPGRSQLRGRAWHAARRRLRPARGSDSLLHASGLQYDAKLCEMMDTYDRAFLVHADNVGSKQFMDIRAVSRQRWSAGRRA